jgi:hypothetical protein
MAFSNLINRLQRPGRIVAAIGLVLLAIVVTGAEKRASNPYEVIAGYLRAFPAYVQWPTNSIPEPERPWQIGILGSDPFDDVLQTAVRDYKINGRGFKITQALNLKDLPTCEIIFITLKNEDEVKKSLEELASKPALTVGEYDDFLDLGGMIQLQRRDTIKIMINLDRARAAQLKIPAKMLEVAAEVVDKGVRRNLKGRQ